MTDTGSFLGTNVFAYCFNNPANHVDDAGYWVRAVIAGKAGQFLVVLLMAIGRALEYQDGTYFGLLALLLG